MSPIYLDSLLCFVILEDDFDFWQICVKSQCLSMKKNKINRSLMFHPKWHLSRMWVVNIIILKYRILLFFVVVIPVERVRLVESTLRAVMTCSAAMVFLVSFSQMSLASEASR